jgi:hypothetical protein
MDDAKEIIKRMKKREERITLYHDQSVRLIESARKLIDANENDLEKLKLLNQTATTRLRSDAGCSRCRNGVGSDMLCAACTRELYPEKTRLRSDGEWPV